MRMFAIAAGYEDANDCTNLQDDPGFKMAGGRAPESGEALSPRPTRPATFSPRSNPIAARVVADATQRRDRDRDRRNLPPPRNRVTVMTRNG